MNKIRYAKKLQRKSGTQVAAEYMRRAGYCLTAARMVLAVRKA